jgi:hypothetical protein
MTHGYVCLGSMLTYVLGPVGVCVRYQDAGFWVKEAVEGLYGSNMVLYGNGVILTFYLYILCIPIFD